MHRPKTGRPPPLPQRTDVLSRLPRKLRRLVYRNYRRRDRFRRYDRLGLRLLLNYANYVDRQLIIHEPYEAALLDHLLREADRQPWDLFIDVEGHEAQVIAGMQRLLEDNDCLIQLEVFDTGMVQIDARLAGLGYCRYASFGHDRLYRRV